MLRQEFVDVALHALRQSGVGRAVVVGAGGHAGVLAAVVVELVARGKMEGPFGVRVSEEFNPMPVLALLEPYGFPAGIHEMESEYREATEEENFKKYLV